MAFKHIYADHLNGEEVEYELKLRGKQDELKNDVEAKYRLLRYLFKDDEKEGRVYESPHTIDQEYDLVCSRLKELRSKLASKTNDKAVYSRLNHYWCRVHRIMTTDPESERMRKELLSDIRAELSKFEKGKEEDKRLDSFSLELRGNSDGNAYKLDRPEEGAQGSRKEVGGKKTSGTSDRNLEPARTQSEPSEREKALEAQVALLQKQVEALLNSSEGARGGDVEHKERVKEKGKEYDKYAFQNKKLDSYVEGSVPPRQEIDVRGRQSERQHEPLFGQQVPRSVYYERERKVRSEEYEGDDSGRQGNNRLNDCEIDYRRTRVVREENGPWRNDQQRSWGTQRDVELRRNRAYESRAFHAQTSQRDQQRRLYELERNDTTYEPQSGYHDGREVNYRHRDESSRDWSRERRNRRGELYGQDFHNLPRNQIPLSSDEFSEDERFHNLMNHPRRRNQRRISESEIRDADRRMEKWHLSFSGDARSRSLEDFLLKVRRLAKMDRIADDVLMQRVHTILRGEAYVLMLCR
ncbi:trichohyalin-like [Armigeres subalbatus]|uniref:trichohyalin-like n=1 Tax=Armigeres subalbatus TaxID=124917 RepID=UPI002ED18A1D